MTQSGQELRIFVAMPGTTMGPNAAWNNPDEIKQEFYEKIREHATSVLERNVVLFIEKDKERSGDILASMYRECWNADIYIADLTGSNANVYLELGARWALRNNITIIVTQSVADLQFNVAAARSFLYARQPEVLQKAIDAVVRAIAEGLKSKETDNPIREAVDVVIEPRAEHTALMEYKSRYEAAVHQISAAYVLAGNLAKDSKDSAERLKCFQKAVAIDPTSVEGWVGYVTELRNPGDYDAAIRIAKEGIAQNPAAAQLYGQLGLAYSKNGRLDDAVEALTHALTLQPDSAEFNSNLGGVWRRKAFVVGLAHALSVPYAAKARDYYRAALRIAETKVGGDADNDIAYALGNVARLDFVLANYLPQNRYVADEDLRRLRAICRDKLDRDSDDFYRRFDLADTFLLSDNIPEGVRQYREGIRSVPPSARPNVLSTVAEPLTQFLSLDVVGDPAMRAAMREIVGELQAARSLPPS